MSYSYGPTVIYPAFTMGDAGYACSTFAKENSIGFAMPATKDFMAYEESSSCIQHSTGHLQATSTSGRVPFGERSQNTTSSLQQPAAKRPSGAASKASKPTAPPAVQVQVQQWNDIDAENRDNPLACSEYAQAIFEHLNAAELTNRPNPGYVYHVQHDMTPHMRRILVDWLVEVAQEYRLTSDTLHLTIDLLNRFLSVQNVAREELQLAGIACMWIAAKFEEIYAPTARNFCYITDNTYSQQALVDMEARVLAALGFTIAVPTAKTFQRRYLQAAAADEQLHYLAAFLLELSLMDEQLLAFLPSQLAAASTYLARCMLCCPDPWDPTLAHYSRYREADVVPVAAELAFTHHIIINGSDSSFAAIMDKYSSERLLGVSQLPPCMVLLQESKRWQQQQQQAVQAAVAAACTANSSSPVEGTSSSSSEMGSPAMMAAAGSDASSDMDLV